ncbi:hypothetical protein QBC47DRAFT_378389 [Echria macrotheca]|uniref:Zn(2)-C6 fungal-type domain-containing protein n=1 Tax=Echria macrotheca TaxID=438768 RepID=A0AAJ0BF36_9PEZI|nr:hypothetical protein QBC47DRAFT_378389 [Echria macrotheca]
MADTPPSPAPGGFPFPTDPEPSRSAFMAAIRAKIDDIERRRFEASTLMRDRLHAAVVDYKRADQSFVDEHTACLNQLLAAYPDASTLAWAQPCLGVPDRELFARDGIAIKYHPSSDPAGFGALARGPSPSPSADDMLGVLLAPNSSSSTSPLSSVPPSPIEMPDTFDIDEHLTPKPAPHDDSAPPPTPSKTWAARPARHPSTVPASSSSSTSNDSSSPSAFEDDPPSEDELVADIKPPPQSRPKYKYRHKRPMSGHPTVGAKRRKPLPNSPREHNTTSNNARQPAVPTTPPSKPPPETRVRQSRRICLTCTRNKENCDRKSPCSACVRKGQREQCRYPENEQCRYPERRVARR